jgi:hypothetical protein
MAKLLKKTVWLNRLNNNITLNFCAIEDEEWLETEFGRANITNILKSVDADKILKMLWHFLDDESKRKVASVRFEKWDNMKPEPLIIDDPVERLKKLICGAAELTEITMAVFYTINNSSPDEQLNQKKKQLVEKSSRKSKSMTSLRQSTDTP